MTLNYLEHIDMENKSINIIIDTLIKIIIHQSSMNVFVSKEINNKVNFEIFLKFTENGFEHKIPDLAFPYICVYWLNKDKFEDSSIIYDENIKRSKINMHGSISLATLHV